MPSAIAMQLNAVVTPDSPTLKLELPSAPSLTWRTRMRYPTSLVPAPSMVSDPVLLTQAKNKSPERYCNKRISTHL